MKSLNFNDRLSYLAWRKEWKVAYAQISIDIRQSKQAWKDRQRQVYLSIIDQGKPWESIGAYFEDKPLYHSNTFYVPCLALVRHRETARELLEVLQAAKEKSAKQREAQVEAILAARMVA
jgi:hypothetical protein